ncbi:MAG TPA: hypothetical protein VJ596_09030 [Gemmatimonadaceae bacterium]|nr:hypothetical protein [Gemmatimonadaceae bacterium]
MGGKASNTYQSNRPESGGSDRDQLREKSGMLEREKQEFAASQKAKEEDATQEQHGEEPRANEGRHDAESEK